MSVPTSLILALIAVESGGNDHAWGDNGRAWGCLQITAAVMEDVQRINPQDRYYNAFVRDDAIWICRTYLNHYVTRGRIGHEPTLADYARVWNGGPKGYLKIETRPYWLKVKKALSSGASPVGGTTKQSRPGAKSGHPRPQPATQRD